MTKEQVENIQDAAQAAQSDADGDDKRDRSKPARHPLVTGLFLSLPKDGESWTLEEAVDWLQTAARNFRLAYKIIGTISVSAVLPGKSLE